MIFYCWHARPGTNALWNSMQARKSTEIILCATLLWSCWFLFFFYRCCGIAFTFLFWRFWFLRFFFALPDDRIDDNNFGMVVVAAATRKSYTYKKLFIFTVGYKQVEWRRWSSRKKKATKMSYTFFFLLFYRSKVRSHIITLSCKQIAYEFRVELWASSRHWATRVFRVFLLCTNQVSPLVCLHAFFYSFKQYYLHIRQHHTSTTSDTYTREIEQCDSRKIREKIKKKKKSSSSKNHFLQR